MQITSFPKYIFWQYKPEADLPDLVVLENLLLYGDLDILFKIPHLFSNQQISLVQKKMENNKRWKKRAFFIDQILLAK